MEKIPLGFYRQNNYPAGRKDPGPKFSFDYEFVSVQVLQFNLAHDFPIETKDRVAFYLPTTAFLCA